MSDTRLVDLTAATTTNASDLLYTVQASEDKKITLQTLLANIKTPISSTSTLTVAGLLTANGGVDVVNSNLTVDGSAGDFSVSSGGNVLRLGQYVATATVSMELGLDRTGDGASFIDLHSSSGLDYSARIIRNSGANGSLAITQTGTGGVNLTTGSGGLSVSGLATFNGGITSTGLLTANGGGQFQNINATGAFKVVGTLPSVYLEEPDSSNDAFDIRLAGGDFYIGSFPSGGGTTFPVRIDSGAPSNSLYINAVGAVSMVNKLTVSSGGIDVTGSSTITGNLTLDGSAPALFVQNGIDNGESRLGTTTGSGGYFQAFNNSGVAVTTIRAYSTGNTQALFNAGGGVAIGANGVTGSEKLYVNGESVSGGIVRPSADNTYSLGTASNRWSVVYAGTGTINTSDERLKTPIKLLIDKEKTAARQLRAEIGTFKFLDAVAEKGEEKARLHVGMTVQRAIEIMEANDLNPYEYGFICHDEWEAEIKPAWTEQVPVMEDVEINKTSIKEIDGKMVQVTETVIKQQQKTEKVPVYDEDGNELEQTYDKPIYETIEHPEEVIREAGDVYSFRYEELIMFILCWM